MQSIRVLAQVDGRRARAVLDQHRVLYPDLGPEPWGTELQQLDASLAGVAPLVDVPADEQGDGG